MQNLQALSSRVIEILLDRDRDTLAKSLHCNHILIA